MSDKTPKLNQCDRVLIVEGYSDLLFYAEFLEHLGHLDGVFIEPFKGRSNVLKRETLETFLSPGLLASKKAVGIIVDGNSNPGGAAQSLSDHLKAITGRDVNEGAWQNGEPNLGFFVAPDPPTNGEIETLVWNVWASDPAHAAGAASVRNYLAEMEHHGWPAKSPDKARIGAFLAAAYDEDPRLGPGARQNLFDYDAAGFARLRAFLDGFAQPPTGKGNE